MRKKDKKYFVWVPFYVPKDKVKDFYSMTLEEIKAEVDLEELKNLPITMLDVKREISEFAYKSYIRLSEKSWWVLLEKEVKYKILHLKLFDLYYTHRVMPTDIDKKMFYKVYYMDNGKSYTMDFLEYIEMKNKKDVRGKSIRKQIKEKEERRKKYLEQKKITERFLRGEI